MSARLFSASKAERLDKILSNMGYGSRTDVKKIIRAGLVICDGIVSDCPDAKFMAATTDIFVQNEKLSYFKHVYLMMNKPAGMLSATRDRVGRTVTELLPERYKARKLFPVGRLDKDSTGLLLLTNDGELAHSLLSPKRHVEKEYEVELSSAPTQEVFDAFRDGVALSDGQICRPAKLLFPVGAANVGAFRDAERADPPGVVARVVLTEGMYHQVKRMFACFSIHVRKLSRIRMNCLALDAGLAPGESRELTAEEIESLKNPRAYDTQKTVT